MRDWTHDLRPRLEPFHLPPGDELQIIEEVSRHLDDRVAELERAGVAADEARRLALSEVSDEELTREGWGRIRSQRPLPVPGVASRGQWLRSWWQDIRYTIAVLRRAPLFAGTVIAALALTIGPTTAILSIGNWLLWRPTPGVVAPDRLAVIWFGEWRSERSVMPRGVSSQNLSDLRDASDTMADIAGWQESTAALAFEGGAARTIEVGSAAANFFDLLGVRAVAGRTFTEADDQPPYGSPVVMLSAGTARRLFGSADAAIGRSVSINGGPMSVVGVVPSEFAGMRPFSRVDVWYPGHADYRVRHFNAEMMEGRADRGNGHFYTFVARLRPGATFDALQAELDVRVPTLVERFPKENAGFAAARARVYAGLGPMELQRNILAGFVRNLLLVGGVLLLLGCANVSNLLLFRGVSRQHERAIRVALGASRSRLLRLLLLESCTLSLVGAAVGTVLAVSTQHLLQVLLLPELGDASADVTLPLDLRVLGATLGVSVACGLISGMVPAWIGSSTRITWVLARGGSRTSHRGTRLRASFAALQLALSLALVINALLLVATLQNLSSIDAGLDSRDVSVHYVDLADYGYTTDAATAYSEQLLGRLTSDPAFEFASISAGHPPRAVYHDRIAAPDGADLPPIDVWHDFVTDDYFRTLRQPFLSGRAFSRDEVLATTDAGTIPTVLGEALAHRLFGQERALGRRVRLPDDPARDFVIVGVVRDVRGPEAVLSGQAPLTIFTPFSYSRDFPFAMRPVVMVRSSRPVHEVAARVLSHVAALDPTLALLPPRLLSDVLSAPLTRRHVYAWVLSLLGATGFLLAAIGLYGLLAQMVSERSRELGIRVALGAARRHVMGLVMRQALTVAAAGGLVGLGLAALGSRLLESQLFGLNRLEPWVYLVSSAALGAVVVIAALRPATVATQIEPIEALRAD